MDTMDFNFSSWLQDQLMENTNSSSCLETDTIHEKETKENFVKGIYQGINKYHSGGSEIIKNYYCYVVPIVANSIYEVRHLKFKENKWWLKHKVIIHKDNWRFKTFDKIDVSLENKLWDSIKSPTVKLNRIKI